VGKLDEYGSARKLARIQDELDETRREREMF
jgi:hypothetical protein